MIFRFSLYGFLKNQRYFEPFLVLNFLDKGLDYTAIGFLVAIREFAANLMEIPSGAVADLFGRRRAMITSFVAYIASFLIFASARSFWEFAPAMVLYAVGDAFRTGTHKAMIFSWLREEGRLDEKTRVYGFTRSWSKLGSALSIVVATALVVWLEEYRWVFWLSIVPYVAGIAKFLAYPASLDGDGDGSASPREVVRHLQHAFGDVLRIPHLRRLVAESMGFEGVFKVAKDYLQPMVQQAALALPLLAALAQDKRTAVLVGVVYLLVNLLAAWASRNSHRLAAWRGGEEAGVRVVWLGMLGGYVVMAPLLYFGRTFAAIAVFILMHLLQNLFRPMHVSRFDEFSDDASGATILSVENQAKGIAAMVLAPAVGWLVDTVGVGGENGGFWVVAAVGAGLALLMVLTGGRIRTASRPR
ncbi:MFS transporter [bacterium]|nr:MFS transporter [bacterium]